MQKLSKPFFVAFQILDDGMVLRAALVRPSSHPALPTGLLFPVVVRHCASTAASRMGKPSKAEEPAKDFVSFVNQSRSPYHAVSNVKERLRTAGFSQVRERDDWASVCKPGGKYFVTRNASSIIAFAVGKKWRPGDPVAAVGAHTDSPCLRVKPHSKRLSEGYLEVGVETYGGGLWHTWFDRDLSLAGRVMVKTEGGEFHQRLVDLDSPILRIPNLAIHLERQEKFEFNRETQLLPIAGVVQEELNQSSKNGNADGESKDSKFSPMKAITERHHPALMNLIAEKCKCAVDEIEDFELVLYDFDSARLGGINQDLIFSPRLDNLEMTYCSMEGLIQASSSKALEKDNSVYLISLFDHEEVGSGSAQGADSNLLPTVMRRLCSLKVDQSEEPSSTAFEQTASRSFILSADMAHAVHPNYAFKHENNHRCLLNKGPVVKVNANQRYMTNSPGIVMLREVALRCEVPLQMFVSSNSMCKIPWLLFFPAESREADTS